MKSFIGNLIFFAVILLIATRFLSITSETHFPIDIVSSNSMSPVLMEGDLVAWTPADIEDVEVGDVVVFKSWISWPDEKLLVHRVVEVREAYGRTALVTKGDANEYIDQRGPHIPEPYVTDRNLIGKAISIGQQPLKIPFVGYIGILINEGFKVLAQPSASKSTITNVGVFTPLTISVILLVISIFILPEKAKTIKEKIRYYIFDFAPLDLKKTFVFFLIIFIMLLTMMHFFAFDSVNATLGVLEFPNDSQFEIGSVEPGKKSFPKALPAINPGVMPVKGIVYGTGDLSNFVDKKTFYVDSGKVSNIPITAKVPEDAKKGSYTGKIMMFSSPLWIMFPDELMEFLYSWDAEWTVHILDMLSALILTCITVILIIFLAIIGVKYRSLEINLSWHFAPRLFLKKGIGERCSYIKRTVRKGLGKRIGWILDINLAQIDIKPLLLASVLIVPLFFLIKSEILAMVIAGIVAGVAAYFISCKFRRKIVMASILSMVLSLGYILFKTNYFLFTSEKTLIESIALGIGAIGIYLLVLAFLLIPLSLLSWFITYKIRNLKEQKEPLLILEGRCDI